MSILNSQYQQIYIINLQHRKDRMDKMKLLLDKHKIKYVRFPAINGRRPDIYNYWYHLRTTNKHCKLKSPGSFGYLLSLFYILKDAIISQYQQILVMDDDVKLHLDFSFSINQISIPKDWKLIYYGACHQNHHRDPKFKDSGPISYTVTDFQKNFGRGNIDGSHMVGIHSDIFNELGHLIKKSIYPFDSGPLRSIYTKYPQECYVIYPHLAIQDLSESDIQDNVTENYSNHSNKMWGWNSNEYL
jgi:GR25 family glycosyltransferase involved in LPS biosynthesis